MSKPRISAGLEIRSRRGGSVMRIPFSCSRSALYDESRGLAESVSSLVETLQMGNRLVGQNIGLGARPINTKQRYEGGLSGCFVLAYRLAHRSRIAFRVKQIIRDLEGEADVM